MGCDIHCYVEYRVGDYWGHFGGEINPGRDYRVFESLAGVRGRVENAVSPPRGLPSDACFPAEYDNKLRVTETGMSDDRSVGATTRGRADAWVKSGAAVWVVPGEWVSHPDWHSHSWLTTAEVEKAVADVPDLDRRWAALLACMRALGDARLVFWFDN